MLLPRVPPAKTVAAQLIALLLEASLPQILDPRRATMQKRIWTQHSLVDGCLWKNAHGQHQVAALGVGLALHDCKDGAGLWKLAVGVVYLEQAPVHNKRLQVNRSLVPLV